ncbi:MAG: radical SAM protein, partial [Chloroflexi bacterium]|nr:radical SAM protein [Chloroflexota bacterium]
RPIPLDTVFLTIHAARDQHQINYVLVGDSIATLHKQHFLAFLERVHREIPDITLHFNSTVDRWDEDIAAACADLRRSVWFGFESGSQRILNLLQKGTQVEQAYRAAALCEQYDIPAGFNVLIGLPGETDDDYQATMRVLEACPAVHPNPNIFNPLPGTALYRQCVRDGLLVRERDYSIWDRERIFEADFQGPVRSVDYRRVIAYYDQMRAMQADPNRSLVR